MRKKTILKTLKTIAIIVAIILVLISISLCIVFAQLVWGIYSYVQSLPEVVETHDINIFFDKGYTAYNGGKNAEIFFNEYAYVDNYEDIAFHYKDGEKNPGFIRGQCTIFVLDVYYDEATFLEVSNRILLELTGQDAETYFAILEAEAPYSPFNDGYKIERNESPYLNNTACIFFDPRYHTIRYIFYCNNNTSAYAASESAFLTLRIKNNKDENDWIFDYSDIVDSNSSAE